MKKVFSKISKSLLAIALLFGVGLVATKQNNPVKASATQLAFNNIGANLSSTAVTTETEFTVNGYTFKYNNGKKQGDSLLLTSGTGYFYNTTAIPGSISSINVKTNSGAAAACSYNVAFSSSAITGKYTTNATNYVIGADADYDYSCSVTNASYFCISVSAKNGQVLNVTVSYTSNGQPETVNYTSIGNGTASKDSENRDNIVFNNIAGLSISQNKGSSYTDVNTSYSSITTNSSTTLRFYTYGVFAFEADTSNGYKILGVKFTNSSSSSYIEGTYKANTTWASVTSSITSNDTTNLTLTDCTNTTAGSVSTIEAKSSSGVDSIYVSVFNKQSRPTAVTVKYIKPASSDPTSISCSTQSVVVTETVNLSTATVISPAGATTALSFEVKSGSEYIDLNTTTGVVTGKKGGTSVVTITPSNTAGGASAIDVTINVTSLSVPAITIGNDYVIYAIDTTNGNYELTGFDTTNHVGTATTFNGNVPSCSKVFTTESGYYENTVMFKNGSDYLALTSDGNYLHTTTSPGASASWKVTWDNTTYAATIVNALHITRSLQFNYNSGNPRFTCYASTQTAISLYPYVVKSLEDFTIPSSIDVYKTGTATITVTYNPADASDKELNWSSANTSIATVADGVVTGIAVGTTTVTASKTISGSLVSRQCTVNVLNNVASHRGTSADPFDVNDAVNVAKGIFTKDPDNTTIDTENSYYVTGLITAASSRTVSTLTFFIGDDASQTNVNNGGFEIYKAASVYGTALATYYEGKNNTFVAKDFPVGAYVTVYSTFTLYNGTPETNQNVADITWNNYIDARVWAEAFNTSITNGVCDSEGDTNQSDLASAWSTQSGTYNSLHQKAKEVFLSIEEDGNENGTDIEHAIATYDYILKKYNTTTVTTYTDFIGRVSANIVTLSSSSNKLTVSPLFNNENTNLITVIVIISLVSVTAIGGYFFIKRREEN